MNSRIKFTVVFSSTCLALLLLLGTIHGQNASPEDTYRHLAVYTEVLSRIKSDYVEEPDMKGVTLGAVNGLLESIDPFASYLNADQYKQYLKSKDAKKASVGLILAKKFGYVGIVDTVPGSPAAKAGLSTGDVLEAINGVATRDMPLAFAEMLVSGDPGTNVELGVLRYRKPEPTKITLTRQVIAYPSVTAKLLPNQVGLITIQSLNSGEVKALPEHIRSLETQGAKRLVLDLRRDATGSPEDGIALANLFLDKGLITYLQGQKIARQNFEAKPGVEVTKLPLVVITNRGTAGGAEIAAGALLDDKRAQVVGERTYGDAAMRRAITMDDGSAVILSVAKYYSPSGKALQDTGVTPNVPVVEAEPPAEAEEEAAPTTPAAPEAQPKQTEDILLKRAIELATKGAQQPASASSAPEAPRGPSSEKILTPLNVPKPRTEQQP